MKCIPHIILLLLLVTPLHSKTKKIVWKNHYLKNTTYTYNFAADTFSRSSKSGDESVYAYDIKTKMNFNIESTGNSGSYASMQFDDFEIKINFAYSKVHLFLKDLTEPDDLRKNTINFSDEKVDKIKFKVFLPSTGGIVFKNDNFKRELSKLFEDQVKELIKKEKRHKRRIDYLFTKDFWQNLMSWHFMEVKKTQKVPGKKKASLEIFEVGKTSGSSVNAINIEMSYFSLSQDNDGVIKLRVDGHVSNHNSIPGTSHSFGYSSFCRNLYETSKEGHLLKGLYDVTLGTTNTRNTGHYLKATSNIEFVSKVANKVSK